MSGVISRGNELAIVQDFFVIDPVTQQRTPRNPTTVTFTVIDPDGGTTEYVWETDENVTNPTVGLFVCSLDPQLPPGDYRWGCVGTGAVVAADNGTFTVLPDGSLPPVYATVAEYGPCSGWISGDDVAAFDSTLGVGSSTYLLDDAASMASQLMYTLTARQFPGVCQRKVRPCRNTCSCFGSDPALGGLTPWFWPSTLSAYWWGGWSWINECGDSCGCGSESYIKLAGYPVRRILEVLVDGNPLVEGVDYRLDGRRNVIRLADTTTTPPTDRFWPACQNLSLPDTFPGTFSVTYEWGAMPPELGKQAAAQLAVELWRASPSNQGDCRLPTKVTKIVRQGITMERIVPLAELLTTGATGLPLVDAFIAMVNPQGAKRRSAVFSPDVQQFARQVGQDEYGTG